jgi:hypothetical protein
MESNTESLFEIATRERYRFQMPETARASVQGSLGVEDLWDLNLPDLDLLAQSLDAQINNSPTRSFVRPSGAAAVSKTLTNKLEVVLRVIEYKVNKRDAAIEEQKRQEMRRKAAEILADREAKGLEAMSDEELKALLEA